MRFPVKEELSVLKVANAYNGTVCVAGTKSGKLMIWQTQTGQQLGETDSHYMGVSDLDISNKGDLVITGGKDSKVKVFILSQ
jgi:pre-rRNA-processing protein IPI3